MNTLPWWFWMLAIVVMTIAIIAEVHTRRQKGKKDEAEGGK